MSFFLAHSKEHIASFTAAHGRRPVWAQMVLRENQNFLVQESMGHASPTTTQLYQHSALWSLLLSVNADPEFNPAAREDLA
jgi:integrase